jgi:N utilization substance protein B
MSRRGGDRRRAREYALQILFQLDLCPEESAQALEVFWSTRKISDPIREYAERIVRGTREHREEIDRLLESQALHWRISRMPVVDRNILRMALYELIMESETPSIVVIDEAIEVAKRFGNDESGPFVNGILDAVRERLDGGEIELPPGLGGRKPERTPTH